MTLDQMRQRIARMIRPQAPLNARQSRTSAQLTRQTRADLVLSLQGDIRTLQHDIADLSDGDGPTTNARQLASLHRDLKDKQTELGKYQARI